MLPEGGERQQNEHSTKPTDRQSESMSHLYKSRQSLTTIIEERSSDLNSYNTTNLKRSSADVDIKAIDTQLCGFFDDLENRLTGIYGSTIDEMRYFLKNSGPQETAAPILEDFIDHSHPKATFEIQSGVEKCYQFINSMIGNKGEDYSLPASNGFSDSVSKKGDSSLQNAPMSKLDNLRRAFAAELEKTQKLRGDRIAVAVENKAVIRDKQFVDDVRQHLKIDQSGIDKSTLALIMKQRQEDEAQFLFEQQRTIEDLQVNISKL